MCSLMPMSVTQIYLSVMKIDMSLGDLQQVYKCSKALHEQTKKRYSTADDLGVQALE